MGFASSLVSTGLAGVGSMINTGLSMIPGVVSGLGSIYSSYKSNQIANQNLAYQKEYNQQVFDRADSAYSRAAADLQNAGLSKTLAAGSPAQVGGTSVVPQKTDTSQIALQNALNTANAFAQIKKVNAEIKNIESTTKYQNVVSDNYERKLESDMNLSRSQAQLNVLSSQLKAIESKYSDRIFTDQINMAAIDMLQKEQTNYLTRKQIEETSEKIANLIQERHNLTQQEKNLAQDYAMKLLEYEITSYDYHLNVANGLPSTGSRSVVGKIGQDFLDVGKKGLSGLKGFFNFNGTYQPAFSNNISYTNPTDLIFP